MSERPVAEIMGWEPLGDPYCPDGWLTHDGRELVESTPNRPDCDDMLAWLWQNTCPDCFYVVTERYQVNGPSVDTWCCALPDGSEWPSDLKRPTLHAALEAAVRAVAEVNAAD